MEINTELYLSDLTDETKESLINSIIDRLKDDKDEMELITAEIIGEAEDDGVFLTPKDTQWKIQDRLEEKAKDILERTFWAECNIGDEIGI